MRRADWQSRTGCKSMTILVCGGRNYSDREAVYAQLDSYMPDTIIEGGATGADQLAREWAKGMGRCCITVNADWAIHGKSAGPIRNRKMMAMKPDLVLAFPGGHGTNDCMRAADSANINVVICGLEIGRAGLVVTP